MATPGLSPLIDLQAAYAGVCAQIRDATVNPRPSYTVDGIIVDRTTFLSQLMAREEELRKIPGAAPSTQPVFTVHADPSLEQWCG